jgi:alpha-glucosidase (family GH31 glycosyl hydrolase)
MISENATEQLCLRWQQLGAFHSFFRNHNNHGTEHQDPSKWPSVAQATRTANLFRYRHLPYLYRSALI